MSLYNLLFQMNPNAGNILRALAIDPTQVDRLRDASFAERGGQVVFRILCRTGGGNRSDYPNTILTSHASYIDDEDVEYDSTYAYYYFTIPEEIKAEIASADLKLEDLVDKKTFQQKFNDALEDLKTAAVSQNDNDASDS